MLTKQTVLWQVHYIYSECVLSVFSIKVNGQTIIFQASQNKSNGSILFIFISG